MTAKPFLEEVLDLHEFLSAWLTGQVPKGDGTPARLDSALADDFTVIHPNGSSGNKADAVAGFAKAWNEKRPSYALRVADVQTRMLGADLCLVTYKESHEGEPGRERISTAVLERQASSGMIKWLFLQETPCP